VERKKVVFFLASTSERFDVQEVHS